MTWINTNSGIKFFPLNPIENDINLNDIANSLSKLCRYTGQVDEFYSVAEHSVILSHIVSPQYAMHALLHDASEAYMSDISNPLKMSEMGVVYRKHEYILQGNIYAKFGLGWDIPAEVAQRDHDLFRSEAGQLFTNLHPEWDVERSNFTYKLHLWDHKTAKQRFLERYEELCLR